MINVVTTGNAEIDYAPPAPIPEYLLKKPDHIGLQNWDKETYKKLVTSGKINGLECPICEGQKSVPQIVCDVCFHSIQDSRNGAFPDRWTKVEQSPTPLVG